MEEKEILKTLMESWIYYIEEEEKNSLQFDGKKVDDKNKFNLDVSLIKEKDGNIYLTLPEKFLDAFVEQTLQNINKKNEDIDNKKEENISFNYMVALFSNYKVDNNKGKYCPFIIQTNTLSLSQVELQKILQIDEKEKYDLTKQILNDKLTFMLNIFSSNNDNVIVATHNINEVFKNFDKEDIAEIKNSSDSPISLVETLIGINTNETLNMNPLERFKNLLNKIKGKNVQYLKSFIIFDTEVINGATINIKRFLESRVESLNVFYEKKFITPTPIKKYIFGKIEKSFEEYNKPSDTIWLGHAVKHPSAKGQALVTQKLEEGENLIAVQGPPGTGKTTLLLNVIAWALVKRALAIIENKDMNNLILVTSTANKAVENATRDFEETFIKDYEFYSGFFLDFRNIEQENKKIDSFLYFLNTNYFSEAEYKEAKENVKTLQNIVNSIIELLSLSKQIKDYKTQYNKLEKDLRERNTQKRLFFENLEQQNISENKFMLLYKAIQFDKDIKNLLEKLNEKNLLGDNSLIEFAKDLNSIVYDIQKPKTLIERIMSKIFNSKEKAIKEINIKYRYLIRTLGLSITEDSILNIADTVDSMVNKLSKVKEIDSKTIQTILENHLLEAYQQILNSIDSTEKSLKKLDIDITALQNKFLDLESTVINAIDRIINVINTTNVIKDQKDKENTLSELERLKENVKNIENNTQNIFELNRVGMYNTNRLILRYSILVLKNHALKEKQKIIENMELLKNYFINGNGEYREFQDKVLKDNEFYKYLSLVFPVVTSTLHSSPKLFKSLDINLIKNNINPIFISFIDEAGMANVYLPFPIISVSDRVVSVGDPLQIPPVVPFGDAEKDQYHEKLFMKDIKDKITEEEFKTLKNLYSPCETSVYHRSARCKTGKHNDVGQAVLLNEHRRCQKPIADLFIHLAEEYKDIKVETKELEEKDRKKLENFTKNKNIKLVFYDVKGELGSTDNTNKREAIAIHEIIKKLKDAGYSEGEIGIITPFKNQEKYIEKTLRKKGLGRFKVGTVHSFQGQEFPVIIFSTVIFKPEMINKIQTFNKTPNLLNVAVSRAKHLFITVGKLDVLEKAGSTLSKFVNFYEKNQDICVIMPEQEVLSEEEIRQLEIKIEQIKQKAESAHYIRYSKMLTTYEAVIKFKEILKYEAKEKIIIITPWVYPHTIEHLENDFIEAKQRDVDITICYGYGPKNKQEEDQVKKMMKAVDILTKKEFKLVDITKKGVFGTHEKILIVDNTDLYLGSLNWLSHDYYKLLDKKTPDLLRREMVLHLQINPENFNDVIRDMKIDSICT